MIVLYILLIAIPVFEACRRLLTPHWQFASELTWQHSLRLSVAVVFVTTGIAHFTELKHDMLAMLPSPVPKQMWIIYATGLLEFAGAIGILVPRFAKLTGICLILFLICVFPANINAALNDIPFNDRPATPLFLRTFIQALLIGVIYAAIKKTKAN
ncbi:Uncharacterized membrane protein [Pseudidiomarina planktonica]|uniref:Uncharacterized membrane protein n=1 Tax=Pseudidiomarina planktonica TaxID=1323738 RepID=A0A1Y6EGG1_9GAMM|nr:DoxX family protein [Pseudidiomarina planktonica]RUO66268.1 DoxX family protein [Pseudidiomarina planktonica]SMQ59233.1 Uncharacterized membrane protein [Pseudidiomarina planktonica]